MASQKTPTFLNVRELAEMLHVKPRTVYHWVQNDLIPYHRPSGGRKGRVVFMLDEIIAHTKSDK